MVGNDHKTYRLTDILSEKQLDVVIRKALGKGQWNLVRSELKSASDGIAGFLGDHIKCVLYVEAGGEMTILNIFIKRLPTHNKDKANFITDNFFNQRESLIFSLAEEFEDLGTIPCIPKAYINTDTLLVLPDLTVQGYTMRHYQERLDLPHALATVVSLARFHAAYANYETKKSRNGTPYNILADYSDILAEPTFKESPWLQSASELTINFVKTFSSKYKDTNLDSIPRLFVEACDSMRDYEDTVNVLLHKDMWINNIMFKYENGVPTNAMLVDFQCIRYGPPTFDLMIFLYMTTSRSFRHEHEGDVVRHYYKTFCDSLDDGTKSRITNYDKQGFLEWCDRSRMFGMLEAISIFPFVLMDPKTAQKTYDDPDTFIKNAMENRSQPVIAYAMEFRTYREILLEVCEEFIERYVFKNELVSED